MNIGALRHRVRLARGPQNPDDADGWEEKLTPERVAAAIQPSPPSNNERTITHLVTIRFHKQVSMDTVIHYTDLTRPVGQQDRQLFVRGVQNVDQRNREMRLECEEVQK